MKRFAFRLQPVLHLRRETEKERARALGQAVREEEERRSALEQAAARLDLCGRKLAAESGAVAPAGALRNLGLTVEAAAHVVEEAALSHAAAADAVSEETALFGAARVERRVIERLREKREADWSLDASRQEQKDIDGLAAGRRAAGGGR